MPTSGKSRYLWIILLLAVIGGGSWYYLHHKHAEEAKKAAAAQTPPPAAVTFITIEPKDFPVTYEYAGRSAGSREVEIRARVSGILVKRAYTEGATVKEGDTLFEIDSAPFNATLAQTKARYVQATNDWKRAQQLFKQKALSAREYDEAQASYAQLKAEIETANINLGYTKVTAPISGVTSKEGLSEGSLVTADTSLLTRLTQLDPLYVNFAVPDAESMKQRNDLASGKLAMPEDGMLKAEIRFGDGTVYGHEGTINFTDSIIDNETGTVSSRAIVPNPDNAILPGQFVRVFLKGLVRKNAIAIPDQAIMQGPQSIFVYVINAENKVAIKPVVPGELSKTMRLIQSGLDVGDKVLVEGMIKARPDSVVAPAPYVDPADAAPAPVATEEKAEEASSEPTAAADQPADTQEDKKAE